MRAPTDEHLTTPPDGRPYEEQPRWRQDFPIDWAQDDYIARRDFTKFMVLTSLAFTVGQFSIVIRNYFRSRRGSLPVRLIATLNQLPVGGSLSFTYPGPHDGCLLIRTAPDKYVAYSQKCTHLSCPVHPDPATGRLLCPCHHGSFDLATGRPLAGPPRRPLPRVVLQIRGGRIFATGMEDRTV